MFQKPKNSPEGPQKNDPTLPVLKPFSEMTQSECIRLYNFYLNQIERDCIDPAYNPNDFPAKTGQNIISLLRPQSYKYYAFVGVFGESCGFIAYDQILERYVFFKLALTRFSPKKGSVLTQIWSTNDYTVEFNNPFQKRWSRGSRIQFGLCQQLMREGISFFSIPSIQASLYPGFFLEMEYAHGLSLLDWVQDRSFNTVLQMFLKILHAVNYLHSYRVIHRDLKPDNIRIELNEEDSSLDRPVLLDFGMAKMIKIDNEKTRDDITCIGYSIGNPIFRSPTQEEDSARATYRDDVYTLGLVLWSMIHRNVPRVRKGWDLKNLGQRSIWLEEIKQDLTPVIAEIFSKATEIKEERRYQSLDPFIADFENALRTLGIEIPSLLYQNEPKVDPDAKTIIVDPSLYPSCQSCKFKDKCLSNKFLTCFDIINVYNFLTNSINNKNSERQ